jgi:uncharacterized DUF497 family protein
MIEFDWGPRKAESNLRTHRISFGAGTQVFHDPYAFSTKEWVVEDEERWQTFGLVNGVLLMVAYTIRTEHEADELIRIISVRKATKRERRIYEKQSEH